MDRRKFLKSSAAAGAALSGVGMGFFGYEAGVDPDTYTGWKNREGGYQTFNREKWSVRKPTYDKVGPTSRVDARTEVVFSRLSPLFRNWNQESGTDNLPEYLKLYYKENPDILKLDLKVKQELFPKLREDKKKYGDQFVLAEAWSDAMGSVWPSHSKEPPEIADFPKNRDQKPFKMKDPEQTSKLIKKISHQFGSTLVGITKLNPDWVYSHTMRRRGIDTDKAFEVPIQG